MTLYRICPQRDDELPFLEYVQEHNLPGKFRPNNLKGASFDLTVPDDDLILLKLKFRLISCEVTDGTI